MQTPPAQSLLAPGQRPEDMSVPFFPHVEQGLPPGHMLLHPAIRPAQQMTIAIVITVFIADSSRRFESNSETSVRHRSRGFTSYAGYSGLLEAFSHGRHDRRLAKAQPMGSIPT